MNRYGRFLMLGFRGELNNSSGLSAAAKGMKEMIFRLGRRDIYKLHLLFDLLTFDLFFCFCFFGECNSSGLLRREDFVSLFTPLPHGDPNVHIYGKVWVTHKQWGRNTISHGGCRYVVLSIHFVFTFQLFDTFQFSTIYSFVILLFAAEP